MNPQQRSERQRVLAHAAAVASEAAEYAAKLWRGVEDSVISDGRWTGPEVSIHAAPWCVLLQTWMPNWGPADINNLRCVCTVLHPKRMSEHMSEVLTRYLPGAEHLRWHLHSPERIFELSCAVHAELVYMHRLRSLAAAAGHASICIAGSLAMHRRMLCQGLKPDFAPNDVDIYISGARDGDGQSRDDAQLLNAVVEAAVAYLQWLYPGEVVQKREEESQDGELRRVYHSYFNDFPPITAETVELIPKADAVRQINQWRAVSAEELAQGPEPDHPEAAEFMLGRTADVERLGRVAAALHDLPSTHLGVPRAYELASVAVVSASSSEKLTSQEFEDLRNSGHFGVTVDGDEMPDDIGFRSAWPLKFASKKIHHCFAYTMCTDIGHSLAGWTVPRSINIIEIQGEEALHPLDVVAGFDMLQCAVAMRCDGAFNYDFFLTTETEECLSRREARFTQYAVAPVPSLQNYDGVGAEFDNRANLNVAAGRVSVIDPDGALTRMLDRVKKYEARGFHLATGNSS